MRWCDDTTATSVCQTHNVRNNIFPVSYTMFHLNCILRTLPMQTCNAMPHHTIQHRTFNMCSNIYEFLYEYTAGYVEYRVAASRVLQARVHTTNMNIHKAFAFEVGSV